MKYIIFAIFILCFCINSGNAQNKRVVLTYTQDDVIVVLDEKFLGKNPASVKINFDLNKEIFFFKKGYYSEKKVVDSDFPLRNIDIELLDKSKDVKLLSKQLLRIDTLISRNAVTNFTIEDLKESINNNFEQNNFYTGKEVDLFAGVNSEIKNAKYKLAIEILDSEQKRSVYKTPRFLLADITIRWSLLNIALNQLVYANETNGSYLTRVKKTKGYVISDLMRKTMLEAIEQAQEKLISDKKFLEQLRRK